MDQGRKIKRNRRFTHLPWCFFFLFLPGAERKNRQNKEIKVSRHIRYEGRETEGGRAHVCLCACARLGKSAKKENVHLRQPSFILCVPAAEDESRCCRWDGHKQKRRLNGHLCCKHSAPDNRPDYLSRAWSMLLHNTVNAFSVSASKTDNGRTKKMGFI